MRHTIVALRKIELRDPGWITLSEARERGIPLGWVASDIGPRERGLVYRSRYWNTVNVVHDVFVKLGTDDTGTERAVWWEVMEETADDRGRARQHCVPWESGAHHEPLAMLDTSGS